MLNSFSIYQTCQWCFELFRFLGGSYQNNCSPHCSDKAGILSTLVKNYQMYFSHILYKFHLFTDSISCVLARKRTTKDRNQLN